MTTRDNGYVRQNCPHGGYECYTTGYASPRKAARMLKQHVDAKHPPEEDEK